MKLKKILALACCAVLLVCISVGATIAYLTDEKAVTNTFTVGKVVIKLDEAVVDEDGKATEERTETGNTYIPKLVPGQDYAKDPTVTVLANSEDCYVRVYMTINNADALDEILLLTEENASEVFTGLDLNTWLLKGNVKNDEADTRTYEFWYKEMVAASTTDTKLDALYTGIAIPESLTSEQLAKITEKLTISIQAQAIQETGFINAEEAWAAWE